MCVGIRFIPGADVQLRHITDKRFIRNLLSGTVDHSLEQSIVVQIEIRSATLYRRRVVFLIGSQDLCNAFTRISE